MSGFEHYERELTSLDDEIRRYALICGVDLATPHEVAACLAEPHADWPEDKARESLRGLLLLRFKLEAEMLAEGTSPWPLLSAAHERSV
ncbi:hypothetical protein [Azonexus sp. IMCC34839]|uniref:hypothetical protein n=1 Tax=Azonexus sp. IMCC34839 TaxID=3133695 RepID=UPI00399A1A18